MVIVWPVNYSPKNVVVVAWSNDAMMQTISRIVCTIYLHVQLHSSHRYQKTRVTG